MIINMREIDRPAIISSDVCIVGAGVAGISLARELEGASFRVAVLESGGFDAERDVQALYRGEVTGHPYYPLDTARSRQFAGSSNRWLLELGRDQIGARLRPLDAIDFEVRDWVPYSGWPFNKRHLEPYYARAHTACECGPYRYRLSDWADQELRLLPFLNGDVDTAIYHFVSRERFRDYRKEAERSKNVTVYLHANVLEICTKDFGRSVRHVRVVGLDGKEARVSARVYVLALGGIETPRLMLLSRDYHPDGVGNQHDLVGRFFMEHPHLWSGLMVPANRQFFRSTALYRIRRVDGVPILGQLTIAESAQRREKLLNYSLHLVPGRRPPRNVRASIGHQEGTLRQLRAAVQNRSLADLSRHLSTLVPVANERGIAVYRRAARLFNRLFNRGQRFDVFRLNHMSEQSPSPNSRVMLGHERDRFGQNIVHLKWRISEQDVRSIRRSQQLIDAEARRAGIGRLEIEMEDDSVPEQMHGGWHHMGTTRMHRDERSGVVDEQCRVHGVQNLYIAGPSVFPTSGYANPVLTIIALSIRMADHLRARMADTGHLNGQPSREAKVEGFGRPA